MSTPEEAVSPEISGHNPFQLLAYLLFKVRHSLEDQEESNRAPRWVRIARARSAQGSTDIIGKGVKAGIDGFSEALSYMLEITLDIKELLVQTDAGKAMVETTADLIIAATSKQFQDGVRALVGQPPGGDALGGVSGVIEQIKGYMDYIPEPDDVDGLGNELYKILCIEQFAHPITPADGSVDEAKLLPVTESHIAAKTTGKVRLMQWAFDANTTIHGLGDKNNPESESYSISRFGSRRLWQASSNEKLPSSALIKWGSLEDEETLSEFFFDARETEEPKKTIDIEDLHTVLEKLGYVHDPVLNADEKKQFTAKTTTLLRRFQKVNNLPITGMLDNHTINRFMHLDYSSKNIERAKAFDPARMDPDFDTDKQTSRFIKLVNPGAEDWIDENISLGETTGDYKYYIAGHPSSDLSKMPATGGWISDHTSTNAVEGFVALQSRRIENIGGDSDLYFDGERYSEGEAASGDMFFAARHTEPWKAGRKNKPTNSIFIPDDKPTSTSRHRMYQWIQLAEIQKQVKAGYELYLYASVQQRSLWRDRSGTTGKSDQGRFALELYDSAFYNNNPKTLRDVENHAPLVETISPWMPDTSAAVSTALQLDNLGINRKRFWIKKTIKVKATNNASGALIILEGKHQSAYDTDAYFDNVEIWYEIKKKPA